MLQKLLFTLLVIVAVLLFFKKKNQANAPQRSDQAMTENVQASHKLAYTLIAVLALISVAVMGFKLYRDNQTLQVTLINASAEKTHYEVKRKDYKGSSFITVDGTSIRIGNTDRVEIAEP